MYYILESYINKIPLKSKFSSYMWYSPNNLLATSYLNSVNLLKLMWSYVGWTP